MRKFKVTASSNSSTLKVTPYVINKGQSGEYYGLKNAEDNQVLTSAPNNWKSKKGAIAWAKKKGYEVVESACGKKSVKANTANRRRAIKASSPNGYSRDERFALAGEVLYRAGIANQEHGAGIAYYLPGNYVLTFNSENSEMQSPDLIFTIWNPNAKDEFDYAGILYTDLNAANRGTDATEALYNKGFGSLPERKEFTNTDNAFKKALDWVISKAMSRSDVNSSTKRRNRKAVKAGKSLNMKAGLDHSSDWMLRGYKFDGEDVTTERIDFQDDVRKAVKDMFNDPDIDTVDLYRIDTEQDTTGVFEDEEFFATFTREDILSSTKPKKFGVKASKSAIRRKAIEADWEYEESYENNYYDEIPEDIKRQFDKDNELKDQLWDNWFYSFERLHPSEKYVSYESYPDVDEAVGYTREDIEYKPNAIKAASGYFADDINAESGRGILEGLQESLHIDFDGSTIGDVEIFVGDVRATATSGAYKFEIFFSSPDYNYDTTLEVISDPKLGSKFLCRVKDDSVNVTETFNVKMSGSKQTLADTINDIANDISSAGITSSTKVTASANYGDWLESDYSVFIDGQKQLMSKYTREIDGYKLLIMPKYNEATDTLVYVLYGGNEGSMDIIEDQFTSSGEAMEYAETYYEDMISDSAWELQHGVTGTKSVKCTSSGATSYDIYEVADPDGNIVEAFDSYEDAEAYANKIIKDTGVGFYDIFHVVAGFDHETGRWGEAEVDELVGQVMASSKSVKCASENISAAEYNQMLADMTLGILHDAGYKGIGCAVTDEALSFYDGTEDDVVYIQPTDEITPILGDEDADAEELAAAVKKVAGKAVEATTYDDLEPINGDDSKYGYTSNGDPIDESTIDELYRIAERDVLPTTELAKVDEYATIMEDTFEYYASSPYVGITYTINATFDTDDIDIDSYVLPDATWYYSFRAGKEVGELEFYIYVKGNEIDMVELIWNSSNLNPDNYDMEAIEEYVKGIAKPAAEAIYNAITNI